MKKTLSFLVITVLTICLVSFAFDHIVPASPVHAAIETQPISSSADPAQTQVLRPGPSTEPVVFIITGLVCGLFGILAVSPLLIDDPLQALRDANRAEK